MDFIEKTAMNLIRSFFNNSIKNFNEGDLILAIQENRDLWSATPSSMLNYASWMKRLFGNLLNKYFNNITTELMLDGWLCIDRPELCVTIKMTPGGYAWFDTQVETIKQKLLDM